MILKVLAIVASRSVSHYGRFEFLIHAHVDKYIFIFISLEEVTKSYLELTVLH